MEIHASELRMSPSERYSLGEKRYVPWQSRKEKESEKGKNKLLRRE